MGLKLIRAVMKHHGYIFTIIKVLKLMNFRETIPIIDVINILKFTEPLKV